MPYAKIGTNFYISSAGQLFAMGSNDAGQLGMGDRLLRDRFTPVTTLPAGYRAVAASMNRLHSFVLLDNGKVYAAGSDQFGVLGDRGDSDNFVLITNLPAGYHAIAVSSGRSHSLILLDNGQVYAAGSNMYGQLGMGREGHLHLQGGFMPVETLPPGYRAVAIYAGDEHSLVLLDNGKACITGTGTEGDFYLVPGLPVDRRAVAASMGPSYMSILLDNGQVYASGTNTFGELGMGNHAPRNHFSLVTTLPAGYRAVAVATHHSQTTVLLSNGELYQTDGNPDGTGRFVPIARVTPGLPDGRRVVAISARQELLLVLLDNGEIYGTNYRENFPQDRELRLEDLGSFKRIHSLPGVPLTDQHATPTTHQVFVMRAAQRGYPASAAQFVRNRLMPSLLNCSAHGLVLPVGNDQCAYCIVQQAALGDFPQAL